MLKRRPPLPRLLELAKECRGNMSSIGRRLEVNRNTVKDWANQIPEFDEAITQAREEMLDNAEHGLYDSVLAAGEDGATHDNIEDRRFFLRTQGYHRGYGDRSKQEITGKDGEPLQGLVTVYIPDNGRSKSEDTDTGTD